jgi:lysine-ketoglutarate reductase/saccharopine dehydrogenase-like protein (TIGR00300 family)
MCFVANAGLAIEDRFVPSIFRFPQREPEAPLFTEWFQEAGYELTSLDGDDTFEGEGDALLTPEPVVGESAWLWAGYGTRSSLDACRGLTEKLAIEVVPLRLVDERFYHLDTCLFPLPGGRVVYYPGAFDELSLSEIQHRVPVERRLEVSTEDALRFACNAVRIGDTLVTNHASSDLQSRLVAWGFRVVTTPLDEFMLAGGAAKCLCLIADQSAGERQESVASPISHVQMRLQGHLLDSGLMNRLFDAITDGGGNFRVEQFTVGQRHDQASTATVRITAPNRERLDLLVNQLQPLGAVSISEPTDARLETVTRDGVAPQAFYSTTIYPTDVHINDRWVRVTRQRMDAVVVVDDSGEAPAAHCSLIRDLRAGDQVVCGVDGVRIRRPLTRHGDGDFAFMSAGVSSERRVELAVDELAWEMRRIRAREGRIVFVAGPVVIHTGGAPHLVEIIKMGYLDALLTGNALPTHDIELNMFGTSLGVDLARGIGVHGGHQHHIKAINRIRAAGSIRAAVEQGIVTSGVMYACVQHGVEYVLAGSIRDDGPLPDTIMDLCQAQAAYARAIEGADMIVMLSSMLHAIGVGNMTPAGVRLVCVDISPAVVTKLADRGASSRRQLLPMSGCS